TPTAVAAVRGSDGIVAYDPRGQATVVLSFSGLWATVDGISKCIAFVVPGTLVWNEPGKPCDAQLVPRNFQAVFLLMTLIHTPTGVGVTISPVNPQTPPSPNFPPGTTPISTGGTFSQLSLEALQDLLQSQDGGSQNGQAT